MTGGATYGEQGSTRGKRQAQASMGTSLRCRARELRS